MRFPKPQRRHKFGAVRTADGFPSKLEAAVFQVLCLRERAGEIREIQRQARVDLGFGIAWKVDFRFTDTKTGEWVWAEAKGKWERDAALKLRMWENGAGPGDLEIWQGSYRNPVLVRIAKSILRHPACTPLSDRQSDKGEVAGELSNAAIANFGQVFKTEE